MHDSSDMGGAPSSSNSSSETAGHEALKRITLTIQDLTVNVHGIGTDYGETIASVVDLRRIFSRFTGQEQQQRSILKDVTVQVRPGEMCLVLGRPGSGCTSLLRVAANETKSFPSIEGTVRFGAVGPEEARKFRHQTLFNSEEDIHFPTLTVSEAIQFAAATKVPSQRPEELAQRERYIEHVEDSILKSLAISHTKGTLIGNEYVRGVSGGERKRVSIAEVLAGSSPLQCWDQSTRGLDASTALDFVRVLRRSADENARTIMATFYQAGNGIFDLFDKVVVLCEGREIYYGPTSRAKGYFQDMGFEYSPGANVADFLTSVAVPTERTIRPGFEDQVPTRAEDFEMRYKASSIREDMLREISETDPRDLAAETEDLLEAISSEKARRFPILSGKSSPYTVSLYRQTVACTKRQIQIIWGDRWSNILKICSSLIQALVCGSLFYNLTENSTSTFTRPGALFFPILYYALNALSETTASFMGRPILARHKEFGFYRPTAFTLACVISDIPIVILNITLFDIVFYFLVHFQFNGGKFFTNWIVLIVITLCLTSFFRMVGAACKRFGLASQVSGWTLMIMMIYAGYLIPFYDMHVWFRWIAYLNPAYYAFEAVMGSEFGNLEFDCVAPQYVPYGPNYTDSAYRACTVTGTHGNSEFSGQSYIHAQYNYSRHHVWRNFGIVCAFWIFFACMTAVGFEAAESGASASRLIFERSSRKRHDPSIHDEEKAAAANTTADPEGGAQGEIRGLAKQSIFTFKDLDYFVHYHGAEKQLLQKVSGFVKPGQLVALMGTSGAGKTTLMDVLAQRKDSGRIEGSILVDGKPQSISFQRTTGYCEQNDVHEQTSTVREALLFSARLRQNYEIPDSEKVDYVEKIMDLLELTEIQDALVGTPGSGLSIEQRKRLTLAVELVTKPSLLFLDEPTSGLDGQSAYNIVRFMRKLAQAGQAIVCTIHQPSASLFEAFDVLLLLAKGGHTTYFGETGKDSAILMDYFARNGAPCPPDTNPAEHMIDVVQGKDGQVRDWPQLWRESKEYQRTLEEIDSLNASCVQHSDSSQDVTDTRSFATPKLYQVKQVTKRQLLSLWRNPDYVWNKILLHIFASLFAGFTFWMIGDGSFDLQLRLFSIFNFVFVAPGVINQLQPLFLHNRDIFETREKKSKTYHWLSFISAQLLSEIPVLIICGTLYFSCWYFTSGLPVRASISGQVYFQMLLYEFLYTAIGQAIAAYSPNEYFAALANPIVIGAALINFCGIVVPYSQIQPFWRYWMYYLDPFTYLVGGLLEPILWDVQVHCKKSELTAIPLPSNTTCGAYMSDFLSGHAGYVVDPTSESSCEYCPYTTGADYAKTFNINASYYGWRDVGITALFCFSSYALVFLMMKLRSKKTKTAS